MEATLSKIDTGDRREDHAAAGEPWPVVLKYWRTIPAELFEASGGCLKFARGILGARRQKLELLPQLGGRLPGQRLFRQRNYLG